MIEWWLVCRQVTPVSIYFLVGLAMPLGNLLGFRLVKSTKKCSCWETIRVPYISYKLSDAKYKKYSSANNFGVMMLFGVVAVGVVILLQQEFYPSLPTEDRLIDYAAAFLLSAYLGCFLEKQFGMVEAIKTFCCPSFFESTALADPYQNRTDLPRASELFTDCENDDSSLAEVDDRAMIPKILPA